MKQWFCRNCHRRSVSERSIVIKICGCGEKMEVINKKRGKERWRQT